MTGAEVFAVPITKASLNGKSPRRTRKSNTSFTSLASLRKKGSRLSISRKSGSYRKTLRIAAELAETLRPTPDTVIPAQAGIQGIGMKACPVFLDSRLRGNDGSKERNGPGFPPSRE